MDAHGGLPIALQRSLLVRSLLRRRPHGALEPLYLRLRAIRILRIDDVQRIATMLCQEVPGADPFWVKSARSLFVGIALYLFERRDYERAYNDDPAHNDPMPEVPVTIGEVLRQAMASDEEGFSKHWKRIIEGWAAIGKPLSPQCVSLIMDVVDLATQTASSVRKTFTSQLDLWLNPLLDMATSARATLTCAICARRRSPCISGSSRATSSACRS